MTPNKERFRPQPHAGGLARTSAKTHTHGPTAQAASSSQSAPSSSPPRAKSGSYRAATAPDPPSAAQRPCAPQPRPAASIAPARAEAAAGPAEKVWKTDTWDIIHLAGGKGGPNEGRARQGRKAARESAYPPLPCPTLFPPPGRAPPISTPPMVAATNTRALISAYAANPSCKPAAALIPSCPAGTSKHQAGRRASSSNIRMLS